MATVPEHVPESEPVELCNGDHLTREEFHRIYEQMPKHFRAELIGGVVYVASPLKRRHGRIQMPLNTVIFLYEGSTPGVECSDNTTVLRIVLAWSPRSSKAWRRRNTPTSSSASPPRVRPETTLKSPLFSRCRRT